ncbi:MAG TPA: LysR family transcriptional regulator [Ilumatobacter sp.]|nr:LysR family transcriptional regulator [Ilumatobacter sp.]
MESLQRLRVLREVAAHGSFTAAAHAIPMSQPSVSQHMSSLERELGTRLFDRTTAGAQLTPAGEVALRHALRILRVADEARRELEAMKTGTCTPLRVAAFGTACTALLPIAVANLRRTHPSVAFDFDECDVDVAVERVQHADADVAVVFDYAAHPFDARGLVVQHLGDDPVEIVLPGNHPLSRAQVVPIERLADDPWIGGTGFGCRESLLTVCGAAGFAPQVALNSNRYTTTLALVAEGHGCALVPATALQNPPTGVVVGLLRPSAPPRRIWAVTTAPPEGPVGELVDALATAVRDRTRTN